MRTERTAAGGDSALISEPERNVVGVEIFKVEGYDSHAVFRMFPVTVDDDVVDLVETVDSSVKEFLLVFADGVESYFIQDFHGFGHSDYACVVGRTCLIGCRSVLICLFEVSDDIDDAAAVELRHMLAQYIIKSDNSSAAVG